MPNQACGDRVAHERVDAHVGTASASPTGASTAVSSTPVPSVAPAASSAGRSASASETLVAGARQRGGIAWSATTRGRRSSTPTKPRGPRTRRRAAAGAASSRRHGAARPMATAWRARCRRGRGRSWWRTGLSASSSVVTTRQASRLPLTPIAARARVTSSTTTSSGRSARWPRPNDVADLEAEISRVTISGVEPDRHRQRHLAHGSASSASAAACSRCSSSELRAPRRRRRAARRARLGGEHEAWAPGRGRSPW